MVQTEKLFWFIGFSSAFLFGIPQILRALTTVEGMSIAQLGTTVVFLVIQLSLAFTNGAATRSGPEKRIMQVYGAWLSIVCLLLAVVFWNGTWTWSGSDTATMVLVCAATGLIVRRARVDPAGLGEPRVRAGLSMTFKALPQCLLAVKIASEGGNGFTAMAVVMGHVVILSRLAQMQLFAKEHGWQHNHRCLYVSECANEASWILCTLAWIR